MICLCVYEHYLWAAGELSDATCATLRCHLKGSHLSTDAAPMFHQSIRSERGEMLQQLVQMTHEHKRHPHPCMHARRNVYTHRNTYACTRTNTCTYTYIHTHTHTHEHTQHIHARAQARASMHTCMYGHAWAHTHTHRDKRTHIAQTNAAHRGVKYGLGHYSAHMLYGYSSSTSKLHRSSSLEDATSCRHRRQNSARI